MTEPQEAPIVWLLASSFEPRGTSLYTLRLALNLRRFGFEPIIVCESDARIPPSVRAGLRIEAVPGMNRPFLPPTRLHRLVAQEDIRPTLIHGQRRTLARLSMELSERLGVPYVLTIHDAVPLGTRLLYRPASLGAVIAVSPSVHRDLIVNVRLATDLVRVVPSGVDVPEMPTLPCPPPSGRVPVVGTASALEPIKGVMHFLMAAEVILSSGHDVEFLVAGGGPDEPALRRATQELDIANRVTFASHVTSYRDVLGAMDVFVMPSLEQGLGSIMLEAMALGKPVVASRVGGVADFVQDGRHALLVPKSDHAVLADKIEFLLDFPEKARRLATEGQQLVRSRFSSDRMAKDTAEVYRAVTQRRLEAADLDVARLGDSSWR